jgi:hypothetical protein
MKINQAILGILFIMTKMGAAESNLKINPSYQVSADSIFIRIKMENAESIPITLKFDAKKIVQYRYSCSNNEIVKFGYNYDDAPDCQEYRNNTEGYLSKYPETYAKEIILFCSQKGWEKIKMEAKSKIEKQILSLPRPKPCDSIEVSLNLNKGEYEIIAP